MSDETPRGPEGVQLRRPDGSGRDVAVTFDGVHDGTAHWVADITDDEGADIRDGRATLHIAVMPGHTSLAFPARAS